MRPVEVCGSITLAKRTIDANNRIGSVQLSGHPKATDFGTGATHPLAQINWQDADALRLLSRTRLMPTLLTNKNANIKKLALTLSFISCFVVILPGCRIPGLQLPDAGHALPETFKDEINWERYANGYDHDFSTFRFKEPENRSRADRNAVVTLESVLTRLQYAPPRNNLTWRNYETNRIWKLGRRELNPLFFIT